MSREYNTLFKLIIVGDSNVGKSSLLIRFSDDSFNDTYLATIGVDFRFRTLNVDGQIVKIQLWDTAGQERFRTITNAYYKGADGIIMVFDPTNPSSFEDIENYWLKEVENFGEDSAEVILICNKNDLRDSKSVPSEVARDFARAHGIEYFECSAKTAEAVNDTFLQLSRKLLAKRQKDIESGKVNPSDLDPKSGKSTKLEGKEPAADVGGCC